MVRSKTKQQRLDAKNKFVENQRKKKDEDELLAEENRKNQEWRIQQEGVPKAMVMVETKKLQDMVNHFDCRKCGRTGNLFLIKNVSFNTTIQDHNW